jgi:hypothetical protein
MEHEDGQRGRRGYLLLGSAALIVVVAASVAFTATRATGDAAAPAAATLEAPKLSPEQIYPSLAGPGNARARPDYAELFVSGQTLARVARPACKRYRAVRRQWRDRGIALVVESRGADASPQAAARYYANVVWVSQNEAREFARAISRISRSRVSAATRGTIKRGFLVAAFTRDALAVCGLDDAYARTSRALDRVDARISHIIALARLNASSGTELNVPQ